MPYIRDLDPFDEEAQPVCMHLRNKGMFVAGTLDPGQSNELGGGNCWCSLTQHPLGPDDELVERRSCIAGRSCFQQLI